MRVGQHTGAAGDHWGGQRRWRAHNGHWGDKPVPLPMHGRMYRGALATSPSTWRISRIQVVSTQSLTCASDQTVAKR